MPEENEVVEGEVQDGAEGGSEVEAKEEPRVPVHVVKELRDELRESKRQTAELQKVAMQYAAMLQQNNQQPKQVQPEPETDPEIDKLLRPHLNKYIAPIQKELEEAKLALQQFGQTKTQLEAERYIERNLPNLEDIRQDIIKEIESLPDNEKEEVLNNPREIVRIGKWLTRMKSGTTTAKSDMRSRAKAETGAGAPTNRSTDVDPTSLSDKEFKAFLAEQGWFD